MYYVRRAGRFARKKIAGFAHGHHRSQAAPIDPSANQGVEESKPAAGVNDGAWNGQFPVEFLHSEPVSSVVSAGPSSSLSGGKDNEFSSSLVCQVVALYDYETRSVEARWTGHSREVTKVLCAGDLYMSASRDKSIRSWSGTESEVRQYTGHELVVTALDISRDRGSLCSGSRDNSIRLWDVQTGACVRSVNTPRNLVTDLKLGHDRPIIVQTSEDKELHLWDSRNLSVIQTFRKKLYIQTSCDLTSDDMFCLSTSNGFSGNGCEATLWDLRATEPVLEYHGHHQTVSACAFIPSLDERHLIMTSSHDSTVRVWDRESAVCLTCLSIPGSGPLTSISVAPNNTFLVSSFHRGILRLQLSINQNGQLLLAIIDVF